jgi:plastocyanin
VIRLATAAESVIMSSPTIRSRAAASVAVLAGAAALVPLGLVLAGPADGAATKRVRIVGIDFSPHSLTVSRGTTVRWTFEDSNTPHNVTSRGKRRFPSSHTKTSGSYAYRFTKAGTYTYVCTIHFNMKGRVVVR